jgi:hypothetical protein
LPHAAALEYPDARMLAHGWEEGFKIVEVIEVTGPVETLRCAIGTWPPTNKVVMYIRERNGEVLQEETFGFGATLPMAELVSDLGAGLRNDARSMGARFEVFEIPAPTVGSNLNR